MAIFRRRDETSAGSSRDGDGAVDGGQGGSQNSRSNGGGMGSAAGNTNGAAPGSASASASASAEGLVDDTVSSQAIASRLARVASTLDTADRGFQLELSGATGLRGPSTEEPSVEEEALSAATAADDLADLKSRIHRRFVDEADVALVSRLSRELLTEQVKELANSMLQEEGRPLTQRQRGALITGVVSEIIGFGPLEPLLADSGVTEVMVNGADSVYVERGGRLHRSDARFENDAHVLRIIERIVAPLGRRIDETSPMVDARLPDGSRVNAIIPPLAVKGPSLTIRKFARVPYRVHDLQRFGTLTPAMANFLKACVTARLNVLVSGGTGSGKTTTLNVLSSFISPDERIVTIEDAAELQLQQDHVVTLESRPANLEGKGEISIRQLVRNSLRMRPDRIIVGEVRGGEALDMLQAMNTGHDGSLSTVHANTPRDVLSRLETMVLMAGTELPTRAIREQVSSAIQLICHQSRLRDGSRRITHITEVQGMESDIIVLQDIFRFEQRGMDETGRVLGETKATGLRPHFMETLTAHGITLPADTFV
jgi:pilus assembly protein CpaF